MCGACACLCVVCVCGVSDYRCGQPAARPCAPRSYPRWARGRLFSHLLARTLSLAARRKPLLPSTASLSHWVQPVRVCQSRHFGGSIASFRGIACSRREGRPPRAHSRSACCMGVESIRVGGGYGRKVNVGVGGEVRWTRTHTLHARASTRALAVCPLFATIRTLSCCSLLLLLALSAAPSSRSRPASAGFRHHIMLGAYGQMHLRKRNYGVWGKVSDSGVGVRCRVSAAVSGEIAIIRDENSVVACMRGGELGAASALPLPRRLVG